MLTLNTLVKLKYPIDYNESIQVFKIVNINEATNRYLVEIQNLKGYKELKPVFLISANDIEIL